MVQPDRRPSYLSAKTLARELDVSESQVYALVRGGVLPKPIKLSPGCVRWSWAKVQAALYALEHVEPRTLSDPYMAGIRRSIRQADVI